MQPINVPAFEPCGKCAGGKVLRNGKSEQCDCFIRWWNEVRASLMEKSRENFRRDI